MQMGLMLHSDICSAAALYLSDVIGACSVSMADGLSIFISHSLDPEHVILCLLSGCNGSGGLE